MYDVNIKTHCYLKYRYHTVFQVVIINLSKTAFKLKFAKIVFIIVQ